MRLISGGAPGASGSGNDNGARAVGSGASDSDLLSALRRGEPRAPAELWDRYYPLVLRVLARAMGPDRDVDDLVQEVFLRLYRKVPSLRDPTALRGFVLTVTTRVVQSELRLRWLKRWLRPFDNGEPPESANARGADLDAREALARLYGILDQLAPRHRAVFVLRYIEALELTEVAHALDISLATVKRWLPRISRRVFSSARRDPSLAAYLAGGQSFERLSGGDT